MKHIHCMACFPNMNSLNTCITLWEISIWTILLQYLHGIKRLLNFFMSVIWENSCFINVYSASPTGFGGTLVCNLSLSVSSLCLCRNSFFESLKQIGSVQHQGNPGGMGTYETIQHFNDIKEHLHTVRRDVEHLVQRNVQVMIHVFNLAERRLRSRSRCETLSACVFSQNPAEKAVKCPEVPPMPSCLSTVHFAIFIVVQSVLFLCYVMYK